MVRLRLSRARIAYFHDVVMAGLSFVLAQALRQDGVAFSLASTELWSGTALFMAVAATAFAGLDLYRGVWRYASLNDTVQIVKAASLTVAVFFPLLFLFTRLEDLPRSSLIINWLILMVLLGGPRIVYRVFKDRRLDTVMAKHAGRRIPVMLVGAGDAAEQFIRSVNRVPEASYTVVGIVDDKETRVGRAIHGVDVMGTVADLPAAVERLKKRGQRPQRLILTKEHLDGAVVRSALDVADSLGLTLARLPRLTDFREGVGEVAEVRPIAIEDLLGRPQAVLDRPAMQALIAGKRVMVTGAGGTIGGELVRQISEFAPAHVTLVENSEFHLYEIDLMLGERHAELPRSAVLADIRDRDRVDAVFAEARPELVFHAAALKHVPMVEAHPAEGVLTNVLGTRNVADACRAAGVPVMVQISTDKAVNPSSVMGATKRLAESYCQALDIAEAKHAGGTRFVTVRFGNVLGSTGSVVPLFQHQLAQGGPLTVTHPEVTRYFMTVREAVELVLQASALGARDAAASGKIFVLDMGEPVRVQDLARQMIRLAGLRPDIDVKIAFTGLRPGEKLYEELLHVAESLMPTAYKDILLAAPRTADAALLARAIDELAEHARAGHGAEVLDGLHRLVPEYRNGAAESRPAAASRQA
jgi:O-antigen biosynthesis protein WbqV